MTDKQQMDALDALLRDAAGQTVAPGDDLMARVLADAAEVQPRATALAPARPVPGAAAEPPGFVAAILDLLGGWPAVSGLAAAGVAGLWVGVAPPAALETLAVDMLGTSVSVDVLSDDLDWDAGGLTDG